MTARMYYDNDVDAAALGADGRGDRLRITGPRPRAEPARLGRGCRGRLAEGSKSRKLAEDAGFRVATVAEAVREADVVMLLVPDTAQKAVYDADIEPNLRPGALLMFAHGFNIRFERIKPGSNVDVGMVAPKGPGHLLRSVYVAGGGVRRCSRSSRTRPARLARGRSPTRGRSARRAPGSSRPPFQGGDRDRSLRGAPRRRLGAHQGRVRDARRGRLPARARVLRDDARAEAHRRPDVSRRPELHALQRQRHGRVRRLRSGPRVAEGVKATMKDVLADIQSGAFGALDRRQEAGGGEFRARQRDRNHQIEQVGAELRAQMPFLNPVVVEAGEAQAAATSAPKPAAAGAGPDGLRRTAPGRAAGAAGPRPRSTRRRPGAGLTAAEKLEVAAARAPQGRRHRGRLPRRLRRRLRSGPSHRAGDEGRHRRGRARPLPRRRPAAGDRGDQGRRAAAPPRVHRDERHPSQAQAPHRPRDGAPGGGPMGRLRAPAAGA